MNTHQGWKLKQFLCLQKDQLFVPLFPSGTITPMAAGLKNTDPQSLGAPLTRYQRADHCDSGENKPACAADGESGWASAFILFIVAANCGAAVYRARDDPWTMAFVVASFLILVALFYALRVFEKLPRESPKRANVKAFVWILSTALTLMFAQRVGAFMPFPAAVLVWVMAVSTVSAGFYMFFLCSDGAAAAQEEPAKGADIA